MVPFPSASTPLIMSYNWASVGFWSRIAWLCPTPWWLRVLSPSLSKKEKASLNSAVCCVSFNTAFFVLNNLLLFLSHFLSAFCFSPEAVLWLQIFACDSVPILASSGNAEIAAPVSYVHLNQPSWYSVAVIWQEFQSTASLESLQELAAAVVLVLAGPTSLLPCLWRSSFFLYLLCFEFHGSRIDSLDSTNILCSNGLVLPKCQQTASLLGFGFWFWCWASFLALVPSPFPFLPVLPFLPFLPHLPKLATSDGSDVIFVATVLNANWLRLASM